MTSAVPRRAAWQNRNVTMNGRPAALLRCAVIE
jgi:hypothetical protein